MKTKLSKVLSVVLSMLMLLTVTSVAFAAGGTLTGSGTKADPYVVSDAAGLAALAADPAAYNGKYIELNSDIDLDEDDLEPIGSVDAPFKGIFDGKGFSIGNFYIVDTDYAGVFGCADGAVISNVTVSAAHIECGDNDCIGAVVGSAVNTQIVGVKVMGCNIQAGSTAGCIAGKVSAGSVVSDCVTDRGSIVMVFSGADIGGIAGRAEDSTIQRCINSAMIDGGEQNNCAGIVGSITGTVSHCLNNGSVKTEIGTQAGNASSGTAGIAGTAGGTITCCGNAGAITSATNCSGIVDIPSGNLEVSFCYNANELSFSEDFAAGSYPVAPAAVTVDHVIGVDGDTVTPAALKQQSAYEEWDFDNVWFAPGDYHGFAYPVLRDCNFHTLKITETDPTCTTPGGKEYKCEDVQCAFNLHQDTAPALGHDWVESGRVEANCTYEGEISKVCSRCQAVKEKDADDVIPVDPKKHVDEDNNNVCDLCKKTIKEEAPAKRNFFQKIGDFFRRIFDWIRNLFKKK